MTLPSRGRQTFADGSLRRAMLSAVLLLLALAVNAADDPELKQGLERLSASVVAGHARAGRVSPTPGMVAAALAEVQLLFPDTPLEVIMLAQADANANALPGGQILINEGLLLQIYSFAELKFLLAHEAAHVAEQHVARHVIVDSGLARADLEIDADRVALDAMAGQDSPLTGVRGLMKRLENLDRGPPPARWQQLSDRLPPAAPGPTSLGPGLRSLHRRAIQVLLHSDRVDVVAAYLDRWGSQWPPEQLAPWHWALAQRRGVYADEVPPWLAEWAQAVAPEIAADAAAGACSAAGSTAEDVPVFSWGDLRIERLAGWRRGLATDARLVLTPGHAALHRVDLWPLGQTPGGSAGRRLPCPHNAVALWHLMVDVTAAFPRQVFELESAQAVADGVLAELSHTDESGLPWRVLAMRRQPGDQPVYGFYRAPAAVFFERRRSDALRLLTSIRLAGGEG